MKILIPSIFIIALSLTHFMCDTTKKNVEINYYKDSLKIVNYKEAFNINIIKGESFNHPTFVIWIEDMNENYLETVFITKSFATGVFGHGALSDSTWDNKPGESIQPAALPYWTYKKGLIDAVQLVPTKEHPFVDAYTGATPKGNFEMETGLTSTERPYRILVEVNQTWDWNYFWTNNKYPESTNYKHSAQPSLIYAVTVNEYEKEFYLNPIGHGDPKGESGMLYTDISTLTGAKEIFKSIKVIIK
jgi:hypothetical protein